MFDSSAYPCWELGNPVTRIPAGPGPIFVASYVFGGRGRDTGGAAVEALNKQRLASGAGPLSAGVACLFNLAVAGTESPQVWLFTITIKFILTNLYCGLGLSLIQVVHCTGYWDDRAGMACDASLFRSSQKVFVESSFSCAPPMPIDLRLSKSHRWGVIGISDKRPWKAPPFPIKWR